MKKLEDYKGQKIAIHFPTYELWLRRREINPSDTCKENHWNANKKNTIYYPFDDKEKGEWSDLDYAERNGYTILPATDFLEDEFIYGQEYEFSSDEDFEYKKVRQFIGKTPCGKFVSYNESTKTTTVWEYARKINTERTEAITTIKELVSKFSINQNEVF